jgi:hypothetical protein
VKVILVSFKIENISKLKSRDDNFFILKSEFSEALKESKITYALVLKEVEEKNPKILKKIGTIA